MGKWDNGRASPSSAPARAPTFIPRRAIAQVSTGSHSIMAKTYSDLFADVRERVRIISLEDLKARLEDKSRPKPLLVDVREKDEFRAGYIPGATHIARGFLEMQAEQKLPDRKAEIVVYCAGGTRSAFAAKTLAELG